MGLVNYEVKQYHKSPVNLLNTTEYLGINFIAFRYHDNFSFYIIQYQQYLLEQNVCFLSNLVGTSCHRRYLKSYLNSYFEHLQNGDHFEIFFVCLRLPAWW
jgi:hypothetical protein